MSAEFNLPSLEDYRFNGREALDNLVRCSPYRSLAQAVASLSVFANPKTVSQTNNRGVFSIVRSAGKRGDYVFHSSGREVMLDDNSGPTHAFIWAHDLGPNGYKDVQFNHLWSNSDDPEHYTNLANLCVLPAFLSKLSDTHQEIKELLRYRSYDLFKYWPEIDVRPALPALYRNLQWSDPLAAVEDLESVYRDRLSRCPRSRTSRSARKLGWYFSGYSPDPMLM